MKAVRYDGRAGERRRDARAVKFRSDCAAAVELYLAICRFLCNCEKNKGSCTLCNWELFAHHDRNAPESRAVLQTAKRFHALRQIVARANMRFQALCG
jgi:hypothetical protein